MTFSRKPGRPKARQWAHKPSEAERRYHRKFMKAIQGRKDTERLHWKMNRCGTPCPNARPEECGKHYCPSCRFAFRTRLMGTTTRWFLPHPDEFTFLTTVIFDAVPHLVHRVVDPIDRDNRFFDRPPRPIDQRTPVFDAMLSRLRLHRAHTSQALIKARTKSGTTAPTDDLLLEGCIEFEVKVYGVSGAHADQFIDDYRAAHKLPKPKKGDRFFSCHTHFLICARKDGQYLDQDQIGAVLRKKFRHRHQVMVQTLYSVSGNPKKPEEPQTHSEAIIACTGYVSKAFIDDANDQEICELALVNDRLAEQSKKLSRNTGAFKRSTKKAIKARTAAINPTPAYKPKSGRRMRDGTRAP